MRKQNMRKIMTAVSVMALVVGNTVGSGFGVYAAEPSVHKEETVYVKIDESGKVNQVTVSDQLKNIKGQKSVKDQSSLKGIENVKGEEIFTKTDQGLLWETDGGSEICYQGTTSEPLPLGMDITYELDGKEISHKELEGMTGHLKITYSYQNFTGEGEDYVPFLMATGMILDNEKFTNVTVENGKILSDGEHEIVVGMGIPGISAYLGLEFASDHEVNIPEKFIIEADVIAYKPVVSMTIATSNLLGERENKTIDSLDELKDALNELEDASMQLVEGSGKLKDGLVTLQESSVSLIDGVNTLAEGGTELSKGTEQLVGGLKATKNGAISLKDGLLQLQQGVGSMKEQTSSGIQDLYQGSFIVASGIKTAGEGAAKLNAGIDVAASGVKQISESSAAAIGGVHAMEQLAATMPSNVEESLRTAGIDEDVISQVVDIVSTTCSAPISAYGTQVEAGLSSMKSGADELYASLSGEGTLKKGAESISIGLATNSALYGGAIKIQQGIGELGTSLSNGTDTLLSGIERLQSGNTQMIGGLDELGAGAGKLQSGANNLSGGLNTLKNGSSALMDGVQQLADGAKKLNEGMIQFHEDGIEKLVGAFHGDVDTLLSKVNHMLENANHYNNFSGISDYMSGEVKFIFMEE